MIIIFYFKSINLAKKKIMKHMEIGKWLVLFLNYFKSMGFIQLEQKTTIMTLMYFFYRQ